MMNPLLLHKEIKSLVTVVNTRKYQNRKYDTVTKVDLLTRNGIVSLSQLYVSYMWRSKTQSIGEENTKERPHMLG